MQYLKMMVRVEWKALTHGQGALTNAYAKYAFADQTDVLMRA